MVNICAKFPENWTCTFWENHKERHKLADITKHKLFCSKQYWYLVNPILKFLSKWQGILRSRLLLCVKAENYVSTVVIQSTHGAILPQSTVQPASPLTNPKYWVPFPVSVAIKLSLSLSCKKYTQRHAAFHKWVNFSAVWIFEISNWIE